MGVELKLTDNSGAVLTALQKQILSALEEIGSTAEAHAKLELENKPRRVDTGNLRDSITHQIEDNVDAVQIGTNVEYAIYVHEGTRKMDPNRFLKNAVMKNANEYKQIVADHMKSD